MISILSETQKSFAEAIFQKLGKGRVHAGLVYREFMGSGEVKGRSPAFSNAGELLKDIVALTDFVLPEMGKKQIDGETRKFLLKMKDGLETESVIIPMKAGGTLCISSQVGCRMGCAFCETGKMGLLRNLTVEEIVAQVFVSRYVLGASVRNIVFMGMGEPLDNYQNVMVAVSVLTDPAGLAFGGRNVTISTCGKVEEIYRLIEDAPPSLNLAVSVNAPNDAIRKRIMPVNRTADMAELKRAMEAYCAHPRRKILVEYVLIDEINDALEHADELAEYLEGLSVKVNVIPYNPQRRAPFSPPKDLEGFVKRLRLRGLVATERKHKGREIMAACGQLGNKQQRAMLTRKGVGV